MAGFGLDALKKLTSRAPVRLVNHLASPIGVDFGTSSLKVLQINGGEAPSLIAAACMETPEDLLFDPAKRFAFQVEALQRVIRNGGFKGKRAVCAIPAGETVCKPLQVQPGDAAAIAAQVSGAIASQMGADPSTLVYRHVASNAPARAGGKAEVICLAARRDLVERLMDAIKAARLEPVGMQCEHLATVRAFGSVGGAVAERAAPTLCLDLGCGSTKVMITHGKDLVFARTIELGGRHLDEAVSKQIKRELSEGRKRRLAMDELSTGGAPPAPASVPGEAGAATAVAERAAPGAFTPAGPDVSEPLEMLTDEVALCLRYHASLFPDRRVERAIFVGGEARHAGLCRAIARTLRLPAQVGDPLARVARTGNEPSLGIDTKSPQPGWAMLVGLCLSPTDL